MKVRIPVFAATAVLVLAPVACRKAKVNPAAGKTAAQLLQEGDALLKRGKFEDGRKLLRALEENLPSSPEYAQAKLLLGDSYFFQGSASYPEALVEYQSFLNFFPKHARRDYALYHAALCHYAAIESAERDQTETRQAVDAFQKLLEEQPGSPFSVEAKDKILQCWRRIAEHELVVGLYYVNSFNYYGAEKRLKGLLETYPDYADRERAYFYLGEALRQKLVPLAEIEAWQKSHLASVGKETFQELDHEQQKTFGLAQNQFMKESVEHYRAEAKTYYQKLVESYPGGEWAKRAADRLLEMGSTNVKQELDS